MQDNILISSIGRWRRHFGFMTKANPHNWKAEVAAIAWGTVQRLKVLSWNTRLASYMRTGKPEWTKELSQQMQEGGMIHNKFTYMVKCSMHVWILEGGRHTDIQIMQNGVYVGNNSIIDMHAKCASMEDTCRMFNTDAQMWCTDLDCHDHGTSAMALELFQQMQQEGVTEPDVVSWRAMILGHPKCV
jgi:pentatricopeptide repeat protein